MSRSFSDRDEPSLWRLADYLSRRILGKRLGKTIPWRFSLFLGAAAGGAAAAAGWARGWDDTRLAFWTLYAWSYEWLYFGAPFHALLAHGWLSIRATVSGSFDELALARLPARRMTLACALAASLRPLLLAMGAVAMVGAVLAAAERWGPPMTSSWYVFLGHFRHQGDGQIIAYAAIMAMIHALGATLAGFAALDWSEARPLDGKALFNALEAICFYHIALAGIQLWSLAAVCDWGRGWIPADFFRAMAWPLALETLGLIAAGIWLLARNGSFYLTSKR